MRHHQPFITIAFETFDRSISFLIFNKNPSEPIRKQFIYSLNLKDWLVILVRDYFFVPHIVNIERKQKTIVWTKSL